MQNAKNSFENPNFDQPQNLLSTNYHEVTFDDMANNKCVSISNIQIIVRRRYRQQLFVLQL